MHQNKFDNNLPWLRVWLAIFFGYLTLGASFQTLPLVYSEIKSNNISPIFITCIVAAASLSAAIIRPFAGKYADLGKAKTIMLLGSFSAIIGVYFQGFLNQIHVMILGRILLGFGEGGLFTAGVTWLINNCPTNLKGTFAGWLGLAMWLGIGLGPILVTIAQKFLVPIIIINSKLLIFLPCISLIWVILTPNLNIPHHTIIYNTSNINLWNDVWRPGTAFLLASYGYGSIQTILLLYTEAHQPALTPISLALFAIIFILIRTFVSPIIAIHGGKVVLKLILPLEAIGLILIPSNNIIFTIIGIVLAASGSALLYPAFVSVITNCLPPHNHGQAVGLLTSFWDLGILLSGILGGALVHMFSFFIAFCTAGGLCFIGLWIILLINNTEEKHDVSRNL